MYVNTLLYFFVIVGFGDSKVILHPRPSPSAKYAPSFLNHHLMTHLQSGTTQFCQQFTSITPYPINT
jgi:hypothetical protein